MALSGRGAAGDVAAPVLPLGAGPFERDLDAPGRVEFSCGLCHGPVRDLYAEEARVVGQFAPSPKTTIQDERLPMNASGEGDNMSRKGPSGLILGSKDPYNKSWANVVQKGHGAKIGSEPCEVVRGRGA